MLPPFFEPDVMLPVQFKHRPAIRGEERLMLAVLGDALARFQKYAFAGDLHGRRVFFEADDWIHCRDREWPFSFENICDVLAIDAEYVRWRLDRWRSKVLATRAEVAGQRHEAGSRKGHGHQEYARPTGLARP